MANKAARVVEYNGVQHSFPGDATDDEISQALGAAYQQDTLRDKMASPTQFELDRNYNNDRPGLAASAGNTLMSLIKGIPNSVRGMFDPATNARRGADLFNADQDRADKGRSLAYRASAALTSPVADVSGMEEEAEHANPEGVIGHAAGSATPYLLPGVAEGGLKGAGAVLEHPLTAKVMPKAARLSGAMMGYAAGHGLGHPYLGMGAGAGIGEVAGEVLADKVKSAGASMRDAGNSIGDFMKPPQPARPPRIPLWKQAGIEAGKPAPNLQVTNVPEPTPRQTSLGPPMGQSLLDRVKGKRPFDVYHGTSDAALDSIREHGLISSEEMKKLGIGHPDAWGLSVSTDPDAIGQWLEESTAEDKYGGNPVILKASIPRGRLMVNKESLGAMTEPNARSVFNARVRGGRIDPADLSVLDPETGEYTPLLPGPRLKSNMPPTPNTPNMPLMPPHENYGFMPPDHPATVSGEAWSKMSQSALTQQFGGRPVLVTDAEPNAIWDTGKGEVILYRKPSPMDRAKMFPQAFNKSAGGR